MPQSKMKTLPHLSSLKPVKHFATGAALTAIAGVPLTMSAPIILSRSVNLSEYGFYSIANTYASVVALLYLPVFTAIYPRLTTLVEKRDIRIISNFFGFSSQFMALTVIPVGIALMTYSNELLLIWQRNVARAEVISPLAVLLVAGNLMAALAHIPYAMQLANGNTKIGLILTLILGIGQIPFLILFIQMFGMFGAGIVFIVLNFVSLVMHAIATNRYIITINTVGWLLRRFIFPCLICFLIYKLFNTFIYATSQNFNIVILLLMIAVAFVFTALSQNLIRGWMLQKVKSLGT
jgi:O-antigen/teichoic acid export membrane protein